MFRQTSADDPKLVICFPFAEGDCPNDSIASPRGARMAEGRPYMSESVPQGDDDDEVCELDDVSRQLSHTLGSSSTDCRDTSRGTTWVANGSFGSDHGAKLRPAAHSLAGQRLPRTPWRSSVWISPSVLLVCAEEPGSGSARISTLHQTTNEEQQQEDGIWTRRRIARVCLRREVSSAHSPVTLSLIPDDPTSLPQELVDRRTLASPTTSTEAGNVFGTAPLRPHNNQHHHEEKYYCTSSAVTAGTLCHDGRVLIVGFRCGSIAATRIAVDPLGTSHHHAAECSLGWLSTELCDPCYAIGAMSNVGSAPCCVVALHPHNVASSSPPDDSKATQGSHDNHHPILLTKFLVVCTATGTLRASHEAFLQPALVRSMLVVSDHEPSSKQKQQHQLYVCGCDSHEIIRLVVEEDEEKKATTVSVVPPIRLSSESSYDADHNAPFADVTLPSLDALLDNDTFVCCRHISVKDHSSHTSSPLSWLLVALHRVVLLVDAHYPTGANVLSIAQLHDETNVIASLEIVSVAAAVRPDSTVALIAVNTKNGACMIYRIHKHVDGASGVSMDLLHTWSGSALVSLTPPPSLPLWVLCAGHPVHGWEERGQVLSVSSLQQSSRRSDWQVSNIQDSIRKKGEETKERSDPAVVISCLLVPRSSGMNIIDVVTLHANGLCTVAPLGSSSAPLVLASLSPTERVTAKYCSRFDFHNDAHRTQSAAAPVGTTSSDERGEMGLVVGLEDGGLQVWVQQEAVLRLHRVHPGPVTHIVVPPKSMQQSLPSAGLFSVAAHHGSVILHSMSTFAPLRHFLSPLHHHHSSRWSTTRSIEKLYWNAGSGVLLMEHGPQLQGSHEVTCWHVASGFLAQSTRETGSPSSTPAAEGAAACQLEELSLSRTITVYDGLRVIRMPLVDTSLLAVELQLELMLPSLQRCLSTLSTRADYREGTRDLHLTGALACALSAIVPVHLHPSFDTLRAALKLSDTPPQPQVTQCFEGLLPLRQGRWQSAMFFITQFAVLKAFEATHRAIVSECCEFLTMELPRRMSSGADEGPILFPPCASTCISFVLHPSPLIQYAARQTLWSTVRCLPQKHFTEVLQCRDRKPFSPPSPLRSQFPNVPCRTTKEEEKMIDDGKRQFFGKLVLAVEVARQSITADNNNATDSNTLDPAFRAVGDVARELEMTAKAAAAAAAGVLPLTDALRPPLFLSVLADCWVYLSRWMEAPTKFLDNIWTAFVVAPPTAPWSQTDRSVAMTALVMIATHSNNQVESFLRDVCERWFSNVAWRGSLLTFLCRMVQLRPGALLRHYDPLLAFAWKVVDPHSPHRSERAQWCALAGQFFRASVQYLPLTAFLQQEQRFAIGDEKGSVSIYDVKSTSLVCRFSSHPSPIAAIAYSPTNDLAVLSVDLDVVRIWRVARGGLLSYLSASSSASVVGSVNVPRTEELSAARQRGPLLDDELIVRTTRLMWLSPSCVELTTPWHKKVQLFVSCSSH